MTAKERAAGQRRVAEVPSGTIPSGETKSGCKRKEQHKTPDKAKHKISKSSGTANGAGLNSQGLAKKPLWRNPQDTINKRVVSPAKA